MTTACDASFATKRAEDPHWLEAAVAEQAAAQAFVAGAELGYDCGAPQRPGAALWAEYRPGDILSFYALVSAEAARRAPAFLNYMQPCKSETRSHAGDPVWVAAGSSLQPLQQNEVLQR
jgi:hypothetical protein